MLGIIVICILSWLALTAYTLFCEPKLLKHWNYSNLGLLGVIAIFGISSFLVVVMIFLNLIAAFLPALGTLSDHPFFAFAFFTELYMMFILFSRKRQKKTSDTIIVPQAVAQVIAFNVWAFFVLFLMFFLLALVKHALNTGEWGIFFFIGFILVWFITGCLFLGACLRTIIEVIRKPTKRTKANLKFSFSRIRILYMLGLLLSLPLVYLTDRTNWALYGLCAVGISWTAPGFLPKNARSRLERRFFNDTVKRTVFVLAIPVVSLLAYHATDWLNGWIYVGVGVILEAFIVFCIFRQKELEELIKRNESRIPKWLRRRLKLI